MVNEELFNAIKEFGKKIANVFKAVCLKFSEHLRSKVKYIAKLHTKTKEKSHEQIEELRVWKRNITLHNQLALVQLKQYDYKYKPTRLTSRGKTRQ
ncbi:MULTISPECIES: hypothetical protein [Pontibacillus]|uniref:Transposase n=1 Tax=Pontibacillus chungwhensis TaxID=265426 RepID=A0ABY8UZB6_9BACI|nr:MULTISPECIES: hypothetical protein [Pontibacillus]MCD5324758.1 hypothetical protein [Pontibacillus sp. HN14]WIF98718.1 hypothetical protein QNI29_03440 [Pontibacillus chungwhensis]